MKDLKTRLGAILFEQAPCQVAVLDPSRRIVMANQSFGQLFGEPKGAHCYETYKARDKPCEACFAEQTFRNRTICVSDEQGISGTGQPISYHARAVPVCGKDAKLEYVVLISVDTTSTIALEERLRQAEQIAKVGLTAAGLAHTIKNILGGMDGAIYTVSSGLERNDLDRVRAGWDMAQIYVQQVSVLVRNLLDYAKEREPRREATQPDGLVRQVVELFASKAGLANIQLQDRVEEGLPPVWLDPQAMLACLSNLVTNAIDACTWDPDSDKEHRILVSATTGAGGGVIFAVEDNGMGISAENQSKLLQAFFTTKGMRGTGLGLLLTKKAVEEHGGSITFSSSLAQGTTFRIALPVGKPTSKG